MKSTDQKSEVASQAISQRSMGPGLCENASISQSQEAITAGTGSQAHAPANAATGRAAAHSAIPASDHIAEFLFSTGTVLLISLQLTLPNFQIIETNLDIPSSNPIQTAIISGLMILWAIRECTTLRRLRRLAQSSHHSTTPTPL